MRRFIPAHAVYAGLFSFFAAGLVLAAQTAPPASTVLTMADLLDKGRTVLGACVVFFGSLTTLSLGLAAVCKILAAKWPWFNRPIALFLALGADFKKASDELKNITGGGDPPAPGGGPGADAGAAKKTASVASTLTMLALVALVPGCALFQSVASNPVVAANAFEQAVENADAVAAAAFGVALTYMPIGAQAKAQADFRAAQADLQHALAAIDDAAKAYADGKAQNWAALYLDAQKAIDAIVAIVDSVTTGAKADLSGQRAELARAVATVHRYHG